METLLARYMNDTEKVKRLQEYRYWASLFDCEKPAGVDCSRIDLRGGEEPCIPCQAREEIKAESITSANGVGAKLMDATNQVIKDLGLGETK